MIFQSGSNPEIKYLTNFINTAEKMITQEEPGNLMSDQPQDFDYSHNYRMGFLQHPEATWSC